MKAKKLWIMGVLAGLLALGGAGVIAQNVSAATVIGTVDNVTDSQIIVEGITILTDNNTQIETTLTPGTLVKIKTAKQSDGSVLAVKIQAKDDRRAIKIEGIVDNVTGNQIFINGKTVLTDIHTLVKGTLAAGSVVEIKARFQDDGSLLAFKIEAREKKAGKFIKIDGVTTNLTDTSLVVDGKTIKITDATKIQGTLAIGARVKIQATISRDDGSLTAVKIKVANDKGRDARGQNAAKERANNKGRGQGKAGED